MTNSKKEKNIEKKDQMGHKLPEKENQNGKKMEFEERDIYKIKVKTEKEDSRRKMA